MLPYLMDTLLGDSNILRDSVLARGTSTYVWVNVLVAAVVYDKIFQPWHALVKSKLIALNYLDFAPIADHLVSVCAKIQEGDASLFEFETMVFDVPGLEAYDATLLKKTKRVVGSGDGLKKAKVATLERVRKRLYSQFKNEEIQTAAFKPLKLSTGGGDCHGPRALVPGAALARRRVLRREADAGDERGRDGDLRRERIRRGHLRRPQVLRASLPDDAARDALRPRRDDD